METLIKKRMKNFLWWKFKPCFFVPGAECVSTRLSSNCTLLGRGPYPVRSSFFLPFFLFGFTSLTGHTQPKKISFAGHIKPILAEKCFHCHGPDSKSRKADLRLDTREGAFADMGGYFAIKPGDPKDSELINRILDKDPDSIMPPPDSHKPLTLEEKNLLIAWIASGARWRDHWAYEALSSSKVISYADGWSKNLIDYHIKLGHADKDLVANPKADRHTLARRAALDITGLPPTQLELHQFLSDSAPDAYEKYIDSLLNSPHYGEHQARFWLDAARYGDTHGQHLDNFREMWLYRDWVIAAFNNNMPFDQFTIEQIAGDLLPNPTKSQLIATGFIRNGTTSSEAGSIPEELAVRNLIDRTETMSTVFLGLTAGCASCHDHKFDALTQKEFYQLAAFFNNSIDHPMDGNMRDTYPVVVVPSPEHEAVWNTLQSEQNKLTENLKSELPVEIEPWWAETNLADSSPLPENDLTLYAPFDVTKDNETVVYVKGRPVKIDTTGTKSPQRHPFGKRGLHFLDKGGLKIPVGDLFQPDTPVTVSMWVHTPKSVNGMMLLSQWGEEDKAKQIPKTGWNIEVIADGAFEMPLRDRTGTLCNTLMPSETPLRPDIWQHIAIRYSGGQSASSITYFVDGQWRFGRRSDDTQITNRFGDHISDILTIAPEAQGGEISDLRIYSRWLLEDETKLLADEFKWKKLTSKKPKWKNLTGTEKEMVKRFYRFNVDQTSITAAHQLGRLKIRSDYLYARNPTTLVMAEKQTPAQANVLIRGEYDKPGENVSANTPAVLPPLETKGPANRLDLAWWLVDRNHPLTSRVIVNRVWQNMFGIGLVKTSEDFGVMGESPTHPELLDYLAEKFQDSGWDVKALVRLIATSSTYRQAATISQHSLTIDPENRYLSRSARRRLDAEVIRDQTLALAGILNRTIGGPSVKPYQPSDLWKTVAFQGSNTADFKLDSVDKIHRRSVYTFWKRTSINPALAAFNAPTRESCTVRRERTNTPLQALVLLNDVQHIEAARKMAEQILAQSPNTSTPNRAAQTFSWVVGRPAREHEIQTILNLHDMIYPEYENNPDEARELIKLGELPCHPDLDPIKIATWTVIINTLFNRDDVINLN